MIKQIWRGWTTPEHADDYQALLVRDIVPGIHARKIEGHLGTEVLRRTDGLDTEIEFVTIMSFTNWDAIAEFTAGDPAISVVPTEARRLLARFDTHSEHFQTISVDK